MKKKIIIVILVLAVIAGICWGVYYYFSYSMASLPQGEFVCESTSPQGTYTVKLYETNPTLSVGGTRGEVVNNKTGKKRKIYWEYNRNLFEAGIAGDEIIWIDDDTVIINNRRLNLPNEIYDWRRK
jgi:hypothetical protein